MARCHLKTLKWSKNRIKNRDIFRQTVSLTFKNKDSYTTILGGNLSWIIPIGFFTIVIFIFILVYGIILIVSMFKKSQVSWNKNTYWRDINEELIVHNITEDDPQIVFSWESHSRFDHYENISVDNYLYETYEHYKVNIGSGIQNKTNILNYEWTEEDKEIMPFLKQF